jgi:hypothetical protein
MTDEDTRNAFLSLVDNYRAASDDAESNRAGLFGKLWGS